MITTATEQLTPKTTSPWRRWPPAKRANILDHPAIIAAVELLPGCHGLDVRGPDGAGAGARAAHALLRSRVPRLDVDRYLAPDIEAAADLVRSGALAAAVESAAGLLV